VRYYTTWIETSELDSTGASDISGSESGTTSEPPLARSTSGDRADLSILGNASGDKFSFPSIHFDHSGSLRLASDDESSGSDETFESMFESEDNNSLPLQTKPTAMARILYIQMVNFLTLIRRT
jgi:eukaryotic translation initiation factor 2-alpha kinase 4